MLKKQQMQEIQDLKLRGYTQTEILQYFIDQGLTPPSRQTIAKYYKMDVVPDNPGEKLAKDKVFDAEPFRSTIIAILEANNGNDFCVSSVYDLLEEKFIENGDYDTKAGKSLTETDGFKESLSTYTLSNLQMSQFLYKWSFFVSIRQFML